MAHRPDTDALVNFIQHVGIYTIYIRAVSLLRHLYRTVEPAILPRETVQEIGQLLYRGQFLIRCVVEASPFIGMVAGFYEDPKCSAPDPDTAAEKPFHQSSSPLEPMSLPKLILTGNDSTVICSKA